MKEVTDAITQLKHKQAMVKAAIQNAKWKQANLMRRVLKVREGVWRGIGLGGRECGGVCGEGVCVEGGVRKCMEV